MTTNTAPPCQCRTSRGNRRYVDFLAASCGLPLTSVEGMPCRDVHGMLSTLIDVQNLAAMERKLTAELPPAPDRYTPGSYRLAVTLFAVLVFAVVAACSVIGPAVWP